MPPSQNDLPRRRGLASLSINGPEKIFRRVWDHHIFGYQIEDTFVPELVFEE